MGSKGRRGGAIQLEFFNEAKKKSRGHLLFEGPQFSERALAKPSISLVLKLNEALKKKQDKIKYLDKMRLNSARTDPAEAREYLEEIRLQQRGLNNIHTELERQLKALGVKK